MTSAYSITNRKLLVGIDEAGYGPNLGPLVVAAVWLELPADMPSAGLWDRLAPDVSRYPPTGPDAIVIDDSKRVYAAANGLRHLERTALGWLGVCGARPATLRELWSACCLTPVADIDESPWHAERDAGLPRLLAAERSASDRHLLSTALERCDCARPGVACQIIMPRRFNELLRRTESKAEALFHIGSELLRHIWQRSHQPVIEVVLDKHGGRNFYAGLLQQAFPETLVLARQEGAASSAYVVAAGERRMETVFLPRADAQHLLVAAASMIAKYVRELCMEQFNAFWTSRVPGLRPTAGYPTDAKRFWDAIQPTVLQLGLAKDLLWRER